MNNEPREAEPMPEAARRPISILIDTDPAMGTLGLGSEDPEDGFAIMLALASPEVDVKAITTVQGNVPVAHGYSNARHLTNLLGRPDIPVAPGSAQPMLPPREPFALPLSRSEPIQLSPLLDVQEAPEDAVDLIARTVMEASDPVTIVTIASLTNVALALLKEPRIAQRARRLVMMGGAVAVPGNITPAAEANIWVDPEAASIVFNSGIPITVVGLDVCHQTLLRLDQLDEIDASTKLGAFAREATRPWFQKAADFGISGGMHLYDTLAVAVGFRPELVRTAPAWVHVETHGTYTYGQTVAYLTPLHKLWVGEKTNCDVCLELVDGPGFSRLFDERVLARLRARRG